METCLIELTHQKARDLLKDLEAMNIIRILPSESQDIPNSQRFRGKLSAKTAEALQRHISESR
mgnify:CR=1 FL=1